MNSTEILSNIATIRQVNSTEIDQFCCLKLYREIDIPWDYVPLQRRAINVLTSKQTLTTSKKSNEFTYSDFPVL